MTNNAPDYNDNLAFEPKSVDDLNKQEQEIKQLRQLLKDVRKLWKGTVFMPDNQEQVRDVLSRIDAAIDDNKIQATSIANIKIQESEE